VLSVEPSSITITSQFEYVCLQMDLIVSSIKEAALKAGIMTDTRLVFPCISKKGFTA
jgi:hypothetical protein